MAATYVECKDKEEALSACEAGLLHLCSDVGPPTWLPLTAMDTWYAEVHFGKRHKFAVLVDDGE